MNLLLLFIFFLTQSLLPYAVTLDQYQHETSKYKLAVALPGEQTVQKKLFDVQVALQYQPHSYANLSTKDYAYYQNKDLQVYYAYLVQNLCLLNNGTKLERAKAFNALAFGEHMVRHHDLMDSLLKVLQAKCDGTGKLATLDRDPYLTSCIYQTLKKTLPHNVYLDVLKAMNDKMSIELFEAEQSYTFLGYYWAKFWETLNRLLNDYTKRSSCTWNQIINHPYNLKLKELQYKIDRNELFEAQELAKQDPLYTELFSSCCADFIAKQNKVKTTAAEQTEKLVQVDDDACPFSFDTATYEFERAQALSEALEQPTFEAKTFSLSQQGAKLLSGFGINPNLFKRCYGNQLQQALHCEHLQIIESSAGIYFVPNQQQSIKDIVEHTVRFVNIARQYNQAGYIPKATSVTDCCWAFLECAQNIAKGAVKGVWQGTKNFVDYTVDHPIETLARPLVGNFILAYRLGQLTVHLVDVGRIGVSAWQGNATALEEWEQLCATIASVKESLAEKCQQLSLEDGVQHATAFVTEALLDYKCTNLLNKFYQSGERKTHELIDQLKNNLTPSPLHAVALTPEGFEIGIAGQAAAVATGETKSLLKKLEDFGGGSHLFTSMEKVGGGKNTKENDCHPVPSSISKNLTKKEVYWTNHGYKHFPPKNLSWKKIIKLTKDSDALYKPDINIEALERFAWEHGIKVTNSKSWKVIKFNQIIGAKNGIETPFMRIEMSANTIHGHPITPSEFIKYLK